MTKWQEVTDNEGRTYYYNTETQETSWTKPAKEGRGSNWQIYKTDEGQEYYYNEATEETTWNKPIELQEIDNIKEIKPIEELPSSEIDCLLVEKPLESSELLNPPHYDTFKDAEDAFVNLLKENNVDSTWSFQKVMSEFINNPIYWAVPDSLHKKKLYDEYLVSKFQEAMTNKAQVLENFEKNFLEVLDGYKNEGRLKYSTRWISMKKILIEEENPIFKHSILSDGEISVIFFNYIKTLKEEHEKKEKEAKEQALAELETYLTKINTSIVSRSSNWEELYSNLLNDSRFNENTHFNKLNKIDILELYHDKIYPAIVEDLKLSIADQQKKNYTNDRKARQKFKKLLQSLNINANSSFEDVLPLLEDDDAFIEICGRNGSSPLELFWDIVDEKYQLLKLKKDLIENAITENRRTNKEKYDYDNLLESFEHFISIVTEIEDDRLKVFNFNFDEKSEDINEMEMIYTNLRKEHEAAKCYRRKSFEKELHYKIQSFANWCIYNFNKNGSFNITDKTENIKYDKINLLVTTDEDGFKCYKLQPVIDLQKLENSLNSSDTFNKLRRIIMDYYESDTSYLNAFQSSINNALEIFVREINKKPNTFNERKRNIDQNIDGNDTKRQKSDENNRVNATPVVLNY